MPAQHHLSGGLAVLLTESKDHRLVKAALGRLPVGSDTADRATETSSTYRRFCLLGTRVPKASTGPPAEDGAVAMIP